jgi:hypothetical protein
MLGLLSTLTLHAILPSPPPVIATSLADCETTEVAMVTRSRSVQIGGFEVAALRDCGWGDQGMSLAIHLDDAWWIKDCVTVAYHAAHMTEAPLSIRFLKQSITRGTLADGSAAAVLRVDTRHDSNCSHDEHCLDEEHHLEQFVMVCALPRTDAIESSVACGSITLRCPADRCRDVALVKGTLHTFDERGANKHTVED